MHSKSPLRRGKVPASSAALEFWFAVLIVVVATVSVYCPISWHEFADWDDTRFIRAVWKPSWGRASAIVKDVGSRISGEVYYNPIPLLSLMADQAIADARDKPQPWIAKLTNLVLHVANTLLVLWFLLAIGVTPRAALLGSLVFALHPIQVGTVAWITERKNLLSTLFYLGSLIYFLRYLKTGRTIFLWILIPLFAAGLLSKPIAVTLPLVLAAMSFTILRGEAVRVRSEPAVWLIAVFVAVAVGWGLFVLSTERTYSWVLPSLPYRPLIASGVVWFYLSKFICPAGLVPLYPRWEVEADVAWFVLLLMTSVAALVLIFLFRKRLDNWALFGVFFFLVNLLPVSGLIPFGYMSHSFVADHFVYLPMVGLTIMLARIVDLAFSRVQVDSLSGKLLTAVLLIWLCVLGALTVRQTGIWANPISMWEATLKVNKTGYAAHNNYGMACTRRGEYEKAISVLRKAIELAPEADMAYDNLAQAFFLMGDLREAKKLYTKSMEVNPSGEISRAMLANLLRNEGKLDEAVAFLEASTKALPESGRLLYELGIAYYKAKQEDAAIKAFKRATQVQPFFPDPYVQMALILLSRDETERAIPLLVRALGLAPNAEAYNALGAAYAHKGQFKQALEAFGQAFELNPKMPGIRDNLANALIEVGNHKAAREFCTRSQQQGSPCLEETVKRINAETP